MGRRGEKRVVRRLKSETANPYKVKSFRCKVGQGFSFGRQDAVVEILRFAQDDSVFLSSISDEV